MIRLSPLLFLLVSPAGANDRVQGHFHFTENAFLQAISIHRHLPQSVFEESDFFRDERSRSTDVVEEKRKAEEKKRLSDFRWSLGYGIGWTRTGEGMRGSTPLPELTDVTHLFRGGLGVEAAFPWDFEILFGMDSIPARSYGGGSLEVAAGYGFSLSGLLDEDDGKRASGNRKAVGLRNPFLTVTGAMGITKDSKTPVASDLGADATSQSGGLDVIGQRTRLEAFFSGGAAFAARALFQWHRYGGADPERFLNYMRAARAEYTGLEGPVPIYRGFPRYELQGTLYFYFDDVWEFDLGGGLMRPWVDSMPYQYYVNPKIHRLFGDRWLLGLGGDFRIEDTHPYLAHPSAVVSAHVSYFF